MPIGGWSYGTETYGEGDPYPFPTTFPTLVVEIAFTSKPFAVPRWVNVSDYVRNGSIRRGRSSDLDRVQAGTLNLTLDNRPHPVSGRPFDPLNPGGPFYGYLTPNRRIRVLAALGAVQHPLFDGYIEDYPQAYISGPNGVDADSVCSLVASDAFALFANIGLAPVTRPKELAGTRLAAILSNTRVGWLATQRDIDTGKSKLLAEDLTDLTALDALFRVDATEQGRMFMAADGDFVFIDRNTLITEPTYTTDQIVFGDDLTSDEVPYRDPKMGNPRSTLRNTVTARNPSWGEFTAEDATSISDFGTQSYGVTVYDAAPLASQATAENLLARHKDPQSRVDSIVIRPRKKTTAYPDGLFAQILPVELGWRVGLRRRGANYTISQSYAVEQITHEFAPLQWTTTLAFGLPQEPASYWVWGTSEWGVDTVWAW